MTSLLLIGGPVRLEAQTPVASRHATFFSNYSIGRGHNMSSFY